MGLLKEKNRSSAREVEIIPFDEHKVSSPPKRRTGTERSITDSKIIKGKAKKLLDRRYIQQLRKKSAGKPFCNGRYHKQVDKETKANTGRHAVEQRKRV